MAAYLTLGRTMFATYAAYTSLGCAFTCTVGAAAMRVAASTSDMARSPMSVTFRSKTCTFTPRFTRASTR